MPHLDHKGPENEGPKTGRKLGKCKKKEDENKGILGEGLGKKRNSGGGVGNRKRIKYNQNK